MAADRPPRAGSPPPSSRRGGGAGEYRGNDRISELPPEHHEFILQIVQRIEESVKSQSATVDRQGGQILALQATQQQHADELKELRMLVAQTLLLKTEFRELRLEIQTLTKTDHVHRYELDHLKSELAKRAELSGTAAGTAAGHDAATAQGKRVATITMVLTVLITALLNALTGRFSQPPSPPTPTYAPNNR